MALIPNPEDYHISEKFGFLLANPLDTLPEYFDPWNNLGKNLVKLLESKTLRNVVDEMPLLDHTKLQGYRQHQLGYTILAATCNCYVMQGGGHDGIKKMLPRQIAIPLCALAGYLGLKPLLNYNSSVYSNYKLLDPEGPLVADNMRLIVPLPGGKSISWLLLFAVEVELIGLPAVFAVPEMLQACVDRDVAKVIKQLTFIRDKIAAMTKALPRFHEHMDTEELITKGLVHFKQWGGELSPLPEGLIYEGVEENKPLKFSRPTSAATSGIMKVLDLVLNIVYNTENSAYQKDFTWYMLPAHREFLIALGKAPSLYDYVNGNQTSSQLVEAYNACVQELADFRSHHLQIVAKYVISGLNKYHHTAPALSPGGNALVMKILKGCRDNTSQTKILTQKNSPTTVQT